MPNALFISSSDTFKLQKVNKEIIGYNKNLANKPFLKEGGQVG